MGNAGVKSAAGFPAATRPELVVSLGEPRGPIQGSPLARTTKLDQTGDARVPRVRNCAVRSASAVRPDTR